MEVKRTWGDGGVRDDELHERHADRALSPCEGEVERRPGGEDCRKLQEGSGCVWDLDL